MAREPGQVLVRWPDQPDLTRYQILKVLPFDSTRKMMSVIVRIAGVNRFLLLTKGMNFNAVK